MLQERNADRQARPDMVSVDRRLPYSNVSQIRLVTGLPHGRKAAFLRRSNRSALGVDDRANLVTTIASE